MAWTALSIPVTGTPIASAWGSTVRDDLAETAAAKFTTAGDLFVGTGANAGARLPAVAAGQVLTSQGVGVAPAWGAAPFPGFVGARVYDTSNQVITTGTNPVLVFGSERFKTVSSMHSTSSNTSRLVADRTGYWFVGACVGWFNNATGQRTIALQVNAASQYARVAQASAGGSVFTYQNISAILYLAANDYVEVLVNQDSGGNLQILNSGPITPEFWMSFLGA